MSCQCKDERARPLYIYDLLASFFSPARPFRLQTLVGASAVNLGIMRRATISSILFSFILPLVLASQHDRVNKYRDVKHERGARHVELEHILPDQLQPRASPQYLTNKTQPFAVDGANLPNVSFDIGESYAGLLPVDNTGKELFFWFVPTTNTAADDEIVIWLNGGPGCSSLDGFLKENGPVTWYSGTYQPVPNQYTWANLSNIVWIDQPVGTGYSQGTPNATGEADVAKQFLPFWKNFMDTFDLHGRKVYVTGESYAGVCTLRLLLRQMTCFMLIPASNTFRT